MATHYKKIEIVISLLSTNLNTCLPLIEASMKSYMTEIDHNTRNKVFCNISILYTTDVQKKKKNAIVVSSKEEEVLFKAPVQNIEECSNSLDQWLNKFSPDSSSYTYWKKIQNNLVTCAKNIKQKNIVVGSGDINIKTSSDTFVQILSTSVEALATDMCSFAVDPELNFIRVTAQTSSKIFEDAKKKIIFVNINKNDLQEFVEKLKIKAAEMKTKITPIKASPLEEEESLQEEEEDGLDKIILNQIEDVNNKL